MLLDKIQEAITNNKSLTISSLPGYGIDFALEAYAKQTNSALQTISASHLWEEDFLLPTSNLFLTLKILNEFHRLSMPTIIFFDEINKASDEILLKLQHVVTSRKLLDVTIPRETLFIFGNVVFSDDDRVVLLDSVEYNAESSVSP